MKRLLFPLVLCAALLLTLTTAHAHRLEVAAWLYDGGEPAPLPGAAFTLTPSGRSGVTGADGTVVFSDLPAAAYQLTQTAAPFGCRTLAEPIALLLNHDGTVTLRGRTVEQVSVLHRSGRRVMLAALLCLSVLPMALRLWWLYRKKR